MANIPALCCPQPAVNPNMQREIPVTPVDPCVDAKPVFICGEAPPTPITLDGTACDGTALPAAGNSGELVQVVQPPGQVFSVRFCSDDNSDFELSCGIDPDTGHTVQTAYKIVNGTFELIKRWDVVTGAEWTGDPATLESCAGTKLESEQELFCDSGVPFLRWYVIEDGMPTGAYVDTDFSGASYTVTNPAAVTKGECVAACNPTISSAFADDLSTLLPGTSISIQKNNCCSIKVSTSAGDFIVSKDAAGYSTGDFDCEVTVTGVAVLSGTCDLADVIVTTQKRK